MSLILVGWLGVENLGETRYIASLHPSKLMTRTTTWFVSLILVGWLGVENLVETRYIASLHPSKLMTRTTTLADLAGQA